MALAGIEVRYLAARMDALARGHYVAAVHGVDRETVLLKMHHPERDDALLAVSTRGAWPTSSRVQATGTNPMVRRLRDSIGRMRLEGVSQPGEERIVTLEFGGPGRAARLVCEFFGEGNLVLCDGAGRILALLRAVDVRHRTLRVGAQYSAPPAPALAASTATPEDISEILQSPLRAGTWLGRAVGLPSRYVERIFADAGLDARAAGREMDPAGAARLHAALSSAVARVMGGDHAPEVSGEGRSATASPIPLVDGARDERGRAFEEVLDEVFTSALLEEGRAARSGETDRRAAELESQISEQDRAIALVGQRAEEIAAAARALQALSARGAATLADAGVSGELAAHGARLSRRRGRDTVEVAGRTVEVSHGSSVHAAASALFDEAKVQAAAAPAIAARQAAMRRELESLRARSGDEAAAVGVRRARKRGWHERYRWFVTTDGLLAVGGRDSSSNMSLVRRRMEEGDTVFHADVAGSPFFVLKGGHGAPPASVSETAHATACFSRAWRNEAHGTGAYWVEPSQVGLAAPSGQFLPRGSFPIEGRRNPVAAPTLRLAVGVVEAGGSRAVTCGPPQAMRASAACLSIIEPGGLPQAATAKRIRSELVRLGASPEEVGIDEIARAMPAGRSRVAESVAGDARA
ncbi:MAG: ribosome rescue protein RqcH [Thaumarchaeota archaeon]|nr:ribosome rescue protein RqcH [Nitrososphaerota archaeon]MDD9825992.1 ribosome rescue protein RqcH [Nitrososphaerota archaeon]MDD9843213.1 ribosome rescue protein RqcH [Nitrososphaerota archaeon]